MPSHASLFLLAAATAALALFAHPAQGQRQPPVLPSMWIADTIDPPEPAGVEAYYFVDNPTRDNPSAMWSNYTDCQRLIYDVNDLEYTGRYLLYCDAVDCCKETQDANQVEFQVDPKATYSGRKNVTSFGQEIEADLWEWHFGPEHYKAYTNPCASCVNNVTLVVWEARVFTTSALIQFSNYTGIPASRAAEFKQMFQIPAMCHNPLSCDEARARGLLRRNFTHAR